MRLVTVATFDNSAEAHAAWSQLDTAGIRATVTDAEVVSQLWHIGALNGVKLQVAEEDAERAATALGGGDEDTAEEDRRPWYCRECHEVIEAGFAVCWSCGRDRCEVADPAFDSNVTAELAGRQESFPSNRKDERLSHIDLSNPYATLHLPADVAQNNELPAATDAVEADVVRAWRAAVIGIFTCPGFLHLYSLCLLIRAGVSGQRLSPAGQLRFYATLAIDLVATAALALLLPGWFV